MSRRILLIEDDPGMSDDLARSLRQDGFTVEPVADGRDGLFLATSGDFDAIILDRLLPGLDGLSVLKALRAAEVTTPVLILSALGQVDERVKGLRAGGDDYLTKPFGYAELSARLDNLLRRPRAGAAETRLSCGDLEIDLLTRRVRRGQRLLDLLPRE
jgi:two-component system OmpR family response regulator